LGKKIQKAGVGLGPIYHLMILGVITFLAGKVQQPVTRNLRSFQTRQFALFFFLLDVRSSFVVGYFFSRPQPSRRRIQLGIQQPPFLQGGANIENEDSRFEPKVSIISISLSVSA
jgi:hypothetical protein